MNEPFISEYKANCGERSLNAMPRKVQKIHTKAFPPSAIVRHKDIPDDLEENYLVKKFGNVAHK